MREPHSNILQNVWEFKVSLFNEAESLEVKIFLMSGAKVVWTHNLWTQHRIGLDKWQMATICAHSIVKVEK